MPFYHKKVLEDKNTTASISFKSAVEGKELEFTCPLTEGFNATAGINWVGNTEFLSTFMEGIKDGANKMLDLTRQVENTASKIANKVAGTSFNGAEQGRLITASAFYKKYGSTDYTLTIPPLVFVFLNEDDTNKHVELAKSLVTGVLPMISEGSKDNEEIRYEIAPNNFSTPNEGFNASKMKGSFTLRLGTRFINYLLPSNLGIRFSADCSLEDPSIPQAIELTVSLIPAYQFLSNDIISLM